ncbi:MAG: hypothetical protein QOF84_1627 [Streptomyces sp.]|jgi:hypothetical protein|nr:hypothetical protein [Streptomyces sp.]
MSQPPPPPGNPYGQQQPPQYPYQQPYQQPQYGYPPQPQQPYYAPQPPQRGGGNGKLIGIVAGAVAAVLVVVGGVWIATSGDSGSGPDAKPSASSSSSGGGRSGDGAIAAASLWTATANRPPKAEYGSSLPDAWFTGNAIVKTMPDSVTSYDIDSGAKNWSVPLSGESCPGSRESSQDRIVVQYGSKCSRVMAIDIAKGTKLWDHALPVENGRTSFDYAMIAVSGDTAAVAWIGGGSAAYRISTGKLLWKPKEGADCSDVAYKGGSKLIAVIQCGTYSNPTYYVQGIDESGTKQWTWQVPSHNEVNSVISTDPVVVGLAAGSQSLLSDVVYLENGKMKSRISLGNAGADAKYRIDCHVVGEGRCQDYALDKDTIYFSTKSHSGSGSNAYGRTNEIAAFDLRTGKAKWLAKPDQEREVTVVGLDDSGGKVIGYQQPTYNKGGRLIAVDTTTHQVTPYMELPESGKGLEDAFYSGDYLWIHKEHFFITAATVRSLGSAGADGSTQKSVAAFG